VWKMGAAQNEVVFGVSQTILAEVSVTDSAGLPHKHPQMFVLTAVTNALRKAIKSYSVPFPAVSSADSCWWPRTIFRLRIARTGVSAVD
jgi:hypothetical protein